MSELLQLPKTTTPIEFFERIVPGILAGLSIPENVSEEHCVFHITGDGGGSWSVGVAEGGIQIESGDKAGAPIQITCSGDDGKEILLGSLKDRVIEALGGVEKVSADMQLPLLTRFLLTDAQLDKLQPFSGNLQLEIDDEEEMLTYRITLTLGGGTPNTTSPDAKLTIQGKDWVALAAREMTPQQALMQGKIRMTGDINLTMGLLGALTAP